MSTITAVAPRIVVDGPLPRPPLYSLASVAQEIVADAHWRAGANVRPYPADMPAANDPCASGTFRVKATPAGINLPEAFPAFTAYLGAICTASGIGPWDEFKARAGAALTAREGWALERQLVAASFVAAPHLGDLNVTVLASGAAVPVETALAYLEDALGATGQDGLIHLTPSAAARLGTHFLRDDRGTLRTARGTAVAVGDGYIGADVPSPLGVPGATPAAGQSWIYVSGPVLFQRASELYELPVTEAEALDRTDDTVIYRAERDLWVAWDTQLQAAVLADWSP